MFNVRVWWPLYNAKRDRRVRGTDVVVSDEDEGEDVVDAVLDHEKCSNAETSANIVLSKVLGAWN